ncbi:pectinesterase [Salvia divinorum]|uniref:Pectinesterase n=1 Tax=Salvia divinorum TaxID=28513 RepID=A0ABD1GVT6_SALDI
MENTYSLKSNESKEEEHHRRNTRRRLIIIALSSAVLLALVAGAVILSTRAKSSSTKGQQSILESICNVTLYQESCYSSISSLNQSTKTPMQIFTLSLQVVLNELTSLKSSTFPENASASNTCRRLIQDAADHVSMSAASLSSDTVHWAEDARTWLSTAVTDQQTCLEALTDPSANISVSTQVEIRASMANAAIFTSNSLAIVSKIPDLIRGRINISSRRRVGDLAGTEAELRPNATVARDGSGDYETIGEAVKAVPERSKRRFFIHVKRGEYKENVVVGKDCWNVVMYGDGSEKTVVSGNLNYVDDGLGPFDSPTLIAEGRGFVAMDMGFKNTAGPEKFQAAALRSSSDRSIFYRCRFDAYQDTLYAHSNRQFYRECAITGTVDFIFGNAAAVFQNCRVEARQPMRGQYNTVTAQSRSDPNQNTGFAIHRCSIGPRGNVTARTFFGRPWEAYSSAVVMVSEIDGVIDPEGWSAWEPGSDAPDSIYYGEYRNDGPGSGLGGRVTWPGYRPAIEDDEAEGFSVEKFIQGSQWIDGLNIRYDPHI